MPSRSGLAILAILASATGAGAQVQNPANGHWYVGGTPDLTFPQARALAAATGGTLVSIADAAEQQWIVGEFTTASTILWIGLSDEAAEGTFLWDSGEPLLYENWRSGEPDGSPGDADSVQLSMLEGGQWQDTVAALARPTVIEHLVEPTVPVAGVSSTPGVLTVELHWQNPIPYDSIEIHRDASPIATLPGTATTFLDAAPIAGARRYWIVGRVIGSPSTPAYRTGLAIDPTYELEIDAAPSLGGDAAVARVLLDNGTSLEGWSYGVCHDDALADILAVEMGDATANADDGLPPAFYSVGVYPGGFTVGVVVAFDISTLPPGTDHELDRATVLPVVAPPAQIPLEFCGTLGPVPVEVVVVHLGQTRIPLTIDSAIDVVEISFIRTDCNGDVAADVADVVFLGAYLFGGGATPPCLAACDANGDAVLDVADMVFAASALFSGGPLPAPPFPDCGPDPAPVLGCAVPTDCP